MDRLAHIAASAARALALRQEAVAHNLANVSTPGFRAETVATRAVPFGAPGLATRVFALELLTGADSTPGAIVRTGRELDVAIEGPGWIAVLGPDGREAYTRSGSLQVGPTGVLETRAGHAVLGEGGPLSLPPEHRVEIARDGTVSAVPERPPLAGVVQVGRIKLVDPPAQSLVRGADGLFRLSGGGAAEAAPHVALAAGALEGSNVNAPAELVRMIALARQFELQMKLVAHADENARRATALLGTNP